MSGPQPRDASRDARRQVARHRAVAGLTPGVQIHVTAACRGRRLAEVERMTRSLDMGDEESAAADVASARQHHREREGRGHRGIHGIAAIAQHGESGFGGQRLIGDHHALVADRGRPVQRERPAVRHARGRGRGSGGRSRRRGRTWRRARCAGAECQQAGGQEGRQTTSHGDAHRRIIWAAPYNPWECRSEPNSPIEVPTLPCAAPGARWSRERPWWCWP